MGISTTVTFTRDLVLAAFIFDDHYLKWYSQACADVLKRSGQVMRNSEFHLVVYKFRMCKPVGVLFIGDRMGEGGAMATLILYYNIKARV